MADRIFHRLPATDIKKQVAILFSGGTDSTFAAVLMVREYDRLMLLTYDRCGFYNTENSRINAGKLRGIYGAERVSHKIINIDKEFKTLCYRHYLSDLLRFGFNNLTNCGLCKLAMHCRTIIYCLSNNIKYIADGSGREMITDPSQTGAVIAEMQKLYRSFGLSYTAPIFNTKPEVREQTLYEMGILSSLPVKWTDASWDIQQLCSQEYLHLIHMQYKCRKIYYSVNFDDPEFVRYNRERLLFHKKKREEIKRYIINYFSGKRGKQNGE